MQKFFRGHKVKITNEFPDYMQHFPGRSCNAIIINCAKTNGEIKYEILILFKGGHMKFCWYEESLLTLIDSYRNKIISLFYKIIKEK